MERAQKVAKSAASGPKEGCARISGHSEDARTPTRLTEATLTEEEKQTMVKQSNSEQNDRFAHLIDDFGARQKNQEEKVEKK